MPKIIKKKTGKLPNPELDAQEIFYESKEFIREKQKLFLAVLVVVIVFAVVFGGFSMYRLDINKKAAALEYEAYKAYYSLHQKMPLQNEEQYRLAIEKFKKAYEMRKSPFSLFYIANCYYDMGRYDDAVNALKTLNEKFPDDEKFVPLSYYKMAMLDLKKGDRDAALKMLDTIYNYKINAFKDLALIESARILDEMGKPEEATKKYEELNKNFASSPFAEEAKARLSSRKG